MASAALLGGCASGGGKGERGAGKEKPAHSREFTEAELEAFLKQSRFDLYGGQVYSQYVDLDGEAPRELLVEVRCEPGSCEGEFYSIQGSTYFLFALSSLEAPEELVSEPISLGPESTAQMADLDGDGKADLILSGVNKQGARQLKIYSVMGKLIANRFDGALAYGTIAQSVMDVDGDGSMEVVTFQRDTSPPTQAYYDPYGYNNGYGTQINATALEDLTAQVWSIGRGSLSLKSLERYDGLERALKQMGSSGESDVMELARLMIFARERELEVALPEGVAERLMAEYDRRHAKGEEVQLEPKVTDPYNEGYPSYDAYGNPIDRAEEEKIPAYSMTLLLAALKGVEREQVATWSKGRLSQARGIDELGALLEVALSSAPERDRDRIATEMLSEQFDVLLKEGPNSPNFYQLAYYDPSMGEMDQVQRAFFVVSFLLDEKLELKGRERVLAQFVKESTSRYEIMSTLLPQQPLSTAIVPHLVTLDLASMPPEFVSVVLSSILPNYFMQNPDAFDQETKKKFALSLNTLMKKQPARRNEVFYFISNYFPDAAFGPAIATMLSSLRAKFESGRATQADRDGMYNAAALLPMAMDSLDKEEREWWTNYVYRQGMGYTLDAKFSETCYDLAGRSEEEIDALFSALETLPKESTLATMCLPYLVNSGFSEGASPLSEAQRERLPEVIATRLDPEGDEYQLQQLLMALEQYTGAESIASPIWKVVKKRRTVTDTARFQALVLLVKMGDEAALKQLKRDAKEIFQSDKLRAANPYFNDYYYADALARQSEQPFIELMLEVGEDSKTLPASCSMLRDYMESYGRTYELNEAQKARYDTICAGS